MTVIEYSPPKKSSRFSLFNGLLLAVTTEMRVKVPDHSEGLLESVLRRYRRHLVRYLMAHLRNSEDVKDLAQEVYLRLLRVEKPTEIREPLGYVIRTASNVISEFHMRQHRERQVLQFDSDAASEQADRRMLGTADTQAETIAAEHALQRAVQQLPTLYRTILLMRACEGKGYPEIARELDLSVYTVKKYYFRATTAIRSMEWT